MFLKYKEQKIDSSQFEISFVTPQSFSDYREIEINSARAGVFGSVEGVGYLSKRFMLKKYLQLSESEILENEKFWKQENPEKDNEDDAMDEDGFSGLGNVGVRGGPDGGIDDFTDDEFEGDFEEDLGPEEDLGGNESPIPGGPVDADPGGGDEEL